MRYLLVLILAVGIVGCESKNAQNDSGSTNESKSVSKVYYVPFSGYEISLSDFIAKQDVYTIDSDYKALIIGAMKRSIDDNTQFVDFYEIYRTTRTVNPSHIQAQLKNTLQGPFARLNPDNDWIPCRITIVFNPQEKRTERHLIINAIEILNSENKWTSIQ